MFPIPAENDDGLRPLRAELQSNPAFIALKQWAIEQRTGYYENLGKQLFENPGTIAESDLDFKRGYWRGQMRLLNQPFFDAQALQADMDRADEAADDIG